MSDRMGPAEVVQALIASVNRGDFEAAATAFGDTPVIVEDLPPYRWTGASAPREWLAAMGANAASLGVTAVTMEASEPTRAEVEGDRAYLVVPGTLRLETAGPSLSATGTLTFTFGKAGGRWLIDTLVWSGPRPA